MRRGVANIECQVTLGALTGSTVRTVRLAETEDAEGPLYDSGHGK